MSYRHGLIAGLLLVSGLATGVPAWAEHNHHCGAMGEHGKFHEHWAEHMEQHKAKLHAVLKLTPEQEPAWQKFTESMQPPPKPDHDMRGEWAKMTAPERAEKMLDLAKQRQERLSEHVAALKTFYAVLTPEQQKVFDERQFSPRKGHRGPGKRDGAAPAPAAKG